MDRGLGRSRGMKTARFSPLLAAAVACAGQKGPAVPAAEQQHGIQLADLGGEGAVAVLGLAAPAGLARPPPRPQRRLLGVEAVLDERAGVAVDLEVEAV